MLNLQSIFLAIEFFSCIDAEFIVGFPIFPIALIEFMQWGFVCRQYVCIVILIIYS